MMKRLVAALMGTALAFGATACAGKEEKAAHKDKPVVATTFTVLQDITKNIAGDTVEVISLTKPGDEIHGFDPTPSTIAEASKADILISNGLGLENWMDKLTTSSKGERVVASEGVTPINIEGTDHPNPHAWMSPALAEQYVSNITKALTKVYPKNADLYKKNAESYTAKIKEVRKNLEEQLHTIPDAALVTCEGAFSYLARDAKMREGYIWPVNADGDVTADQIRQAIDFVKEHKVPATFCESTVDTGPQQQVLSATGAKDGGTLYVDSLTEPSGDAPTYLDLLKHDATTIVKGLKK